MKKKITFYGIGFVSVCIVILLMFLFLSDRGKPETSDIGNADNQNDNDVQAGLEVLPHNEPLRLYNFNYKGVTIDGGHMKEIYDEVKESYLRLSDPDNMLKGFRERAGLDAPGEYLESWYADGLYHMFNQVVSGLIRFYAGTGDERFKERAIELLDGWAETIEPDGFFFQNKPPKTTQYVYEKAVAMLVDAYEYMDYERAPELLSKITDWAEENIPRSRHPLTYANEWYTNAENLFRAYLLIGDERYREYANEWEYHEFWDVFYEDGYIFDHLPANGEVDHFHAYSHLNSLNSAAMFYIVEKDEKYLEIIKKAYDYFMEEQNFATGGFGPEERLRPKGALTSTLYNRGIYKHFETQCGSWAAFKLSKYLVTLTGEARYSDWVELLLYNGIGASLPTAPDGNVQYSSDYYLGGAVKRYAADPWTCCSGTRPQATADYIDQIYFYDDNRNIYVSLYTPSTVTWEKDRVTVKLIQETEYPKSETITFRVEAGADVEFGMRFREPGWLTKVPTAKVNGEPVKLAKFESGWITIDRTWKDGDVVELTLPMELYYVPVDWEEFFLPAAVMIGPVVLAAGGTEINPGSKVDVEALEESLVPIEGEPLHYQVKADKSIIFKPFYEYKENELYFVYMDPSWTTRFFPHLGE